MPSDEPSPPPHVMSIYRLSMLTSSGAPANQVENQIVSMVAAWDVELADDRAELRDRLDRLVATLRSGLEKVESTSTAAGDAAERQVAAFRAALSAASRAQSELE